MLRLKLFPRLGLLFALLAVLVVTSSAQAAEKVRVYIMMGQSNMLGFGTVGPVQNAGTLEHAIANDGLFPYLKDGDGWAVRDDCRYTRVMVGRGGGMGVHNNDWLQVPTRGKFGPELGFGFQVAESNEAPVLLLKSCIGNRSLGWDLLPPGSERFEHTDSKDGKSYTYPGYKDEVRHGRWETGNIPAPPNHGWYAGKQYDDDVANAKKVLEDIQTYYPGAEGYEIAGFVWWQGDKDRYDQGHAARYEQNLVQLIKALREDFNAPDAPFVLATLGQTEQGASGNDGMILQAMLNVDGRSGKYTQFEGNVATVYTHPMHQGGASNSHYGQNGKFYMLVGEALGKAMVELEKE